ncbi:MAG: CDGSH iron-sulfur domain-containing protein [Nitrospinota bacterium]
MVKPKIAQKGPYVMETESGTYVWCGCGLSRDQPFCDNAHHGTKFEGTEYGAVKVDVEEDGTKAWCGCKHTKNPPWCDGSHEKL